MNLEMTLFVIHDCSLAKGNSRVDPKVSMCMKSEEPTTKSHTLDALSSL